MNRNGCVVIVIVVVGRKILLPAAMEDRALESFVVALVERVRRMRVAGGRDARSASADGGDVFVTAADSIEIRVEANAKGKKRALAEEE